MSARHVVLVVCWLCAALGGLAMAWAAPPGLPATGPSTHGPVNRSGPVYLDRRKPLRFDHAQHLAGAGASRGGTTCLDCHPGITASRRSSEDHTPLGRACDACHGAQHPRPRGEPARCEACHTKTNAQGVPYETTEPLRSRIIFNHELHTRAGAGCDSCHGDVRKGESIRLPSEDSCLECHDGKRASSRCGTCHPTDSRGKLRTRPFDDQLTRPLMPTVGRHPRGAAHDLAFVEDHAGPAKSNPALCDACHDESDCQECHAGVIRPMRIHAGDYLSAHAIDARANTMECGSCHQLQSDCRGCHQRTGVSPQGDESSFGVGSPLRFHPAGWSGAPGAPQGHALVAQRNISACASCHSEDTCLSCHATTGALEPGLGVSPHGPGFADSVRCSALSSRNHRVCLKCHAPGDPAHECR